MLRFSARNVHQRFTRHYYRPLLEIGVLCITAVLSACGGGGSSASGTGIVPVTQSTAAVTSAGTVPVTISPAPAASTSSNISAPTPVPTPITDLGSGGAIVVTSPQPQAEATQAAAQSQTQATPVAAPPVTAFFPVSVSYPIPLSALPSQVVQSRVRRVMGSSGFGGYTSTAAPLSISLNVTPVGGSTTNYAGTCTVAADGLSGTCTVTFTAAPGAVSFSGSLSESGNVIATFSQLVIIDPASANSFHFTANPVVKSVVVSLASGSIGAGAAADVLLAVNAYDANGDLIGGNAPYMDANGHGVNFRLTTTNVQNGGNGTVVVKGPLFISSPTSGTAYAHYNGGWLDHTNIAVTSSSSAVTTLTGATLTTTPRIVATYGTGGSQPTAIVNGPDGNMWFTGPSTNSIDRITTAGVLTGFTIPTGGSSPSGLTVGPDGALWFTESSVKKIGRITTGGSFSEFTIPFASASPQYLTTGADGNLWYTDTGRSTIGRMTLSGAFNDFAVPSGGQPFAIATGPDGNVWYEDKNGFVGRVTPAGVITDFPTGGGEPNYGIVTGPDGNIWFTEWTGNSINRCTAGGSITASYTVPTGGGAPFGIAVGPDHNLWFAEWGQNKIGFVTAGGSFTEYPVATGNDPKIIITGPDGNIWFATQYDGLIQKFVY